MVRQSLTKRGIAVVNNICPHRGMTATDLESRKAGATAEEAGKRRCQDDQGERRIQEKDRHKSGHRHPPHDVVLECALADAHHRFNDDGEHRGLQSEEQPDDQRGRSEEHTSELQSLMRISYAVFCLKKKKNTKYT